jgi:hypothetical protein
MPKAKILKAGWIIGIIFFFMFVLYGCSGSGGGAVDANDSDKVAVFGEAQYDAGYTFDN